MVSTPQSRHSAGRRFGKVGVEYRATGFLVAIDRRVDVVDVEHGAHFVVAAALNHGEPALARRQRLLLPEVAQARVDLVELDVPDVVVALGMLLEEQLVMSTISLR